MSLVDILLRRREGGNAALKQRAIVVRNAYLRTRGDHVPSTHAKLSNRVRQSNLLLDLFVTALWIRRNYESWKFYTRHPQSRRKFQELRNSQMVFVLWLADYYGIISLDPKRPFMELGDFGNSYPHRAYKMIGKKVPNAKLDAKVAEVWFALGSPRIFKATNDHFDLDNFFKDLVANRSNDTKAKVENTSTLEGHSFEPCCFIVRCLNTFMLPIESTARPYFLLHYSHLLDYLSQVIAMGNHSTEHMLDVVEELCPELAQPLVVRYRTLLFDSSYDELPAEHAMKGLLSIADTPNINPDLPIYDRQILGYIQRFPDKFSNYPLFRIPLLALKLISEKTEVEAANSVAVSEPEDEDVSHNEISSEANGKADKSNSEVEHNTAKRAPDTEPSPDSKRVKTVFPESAESAEVADSSTSGPTVSKETYSNPEIPVSAGESYGKSQESSGNTNIVPPKLSNHSDPNVSTLGIPAALLQSFGTNISVPPPVQPSGHKRSRAVEPLPVPRARVMRPRTQRLRAFVEAESSGAPSQPSSDLDISISAENSSTAMNPKYTSQDVSHDNTMQPSAMFMVTDQEALDRSYDSVVLPLSIQNMIKENPQAPYIAYNKLQKRLLQHRPVDSGVSSSPSVIHRASNFDNNMPAIRDVRAADRSSPLAKERNGNRPGFSSGPTALIRATSDRMVPSLNTKSSSLNSTEYNPATSVGPNKQSALPTNPESSTSNSAQEFLLNPLNEADTDIPESSENPRSKSASEKSATAQDQHSQPSREPPKHPDPQSAKQMYEDTSKFATEIMENLCSSLPDRTHNVTFTVEDPRWAHLKTTVSITSSTN